MSAHGQTRKGLRRAAQSTGWRRRAGPLHTVRVRDVNLPPAVEIPAPARLRAGARRHAIFLAVLAVGIGLRIIAQIAYWPALLFEDSYQYLNNTEALDPGHTRPIGYPAFLALLRLLPDLAAVPIVQHLMGLAMGVVTYTLLVRWGLWRWAAALATLPVLWDAYQVEIEHLVMSDVFFQMLVLGGLALLAWRRPTIRRAALVGALLGASVSVRLVGLPLIIPAALFVLVMAEGWRRRIAATVALSLAFAAPLVCYMAWFNYNYGEWALSDTTARVRYAGIAHFVQCEKLSSLPDYERPLCPGKPLDERLPAIGFYVWSPRSPAVQYTPPAGMEKEAVLTDFFWRVVKDQPLDFLHAVAKDFFRYFQWGKPVYPPGRSDAPWHFPEHFRAWGNARDADVAARTYGSSGAYINDSLADVLRAYQLSVGYTPGTLLGVALIIGLLGTLGVGRARRSGMRAVCFLFTSAGGGLLLGASLFMFSWRYELPALVLLPVAGGLGLTAMIRGGPATPGVSSEADEDEQRGRDADRSLITAPESG